MSNMVHTVGVESLILEEERLKLSNKSICKYREKKAISSQNVSKAPETVSSFRSSCSLIHTHVSLTKYCAV